MNTSRPMQCPRCGEAHAGCSAHKRSGKPCGNDPMKGQRVCRMHGGMTPVALAAAEERLVQARAIAAIESIWQPDAEPVTDAVAALQQLAGRLQHAANVLGARVDVAGLDGTNATAWLRVLRELRQALESMERLGLQQRHMELEQERANVVVAAFLAALDVAGLAPGVRSLAVDRFLERLGDLVPAGSAVVAGEVEA